MAYLFSITVFVSAALLFLIQPMFAKMLLPKMGGTPAVWNTCMFFFQATLLLGYLYVHLSTHFLKTRWQVIGHALLLLTPALVLPIYLPETWSFDGTENPTVWLLGALSLTVGLPFLVVSTTNPIIQSWYAKADSKHGADPYHLYAASNLGSMIGLLGYPFLVEPLLATVSQTMLWSVGYGLLAILILACGFHAFKAKQDFSLSPKDMVAQQESAGEAPSWSAIGYWLFLAFVPSSLMQGVTAYITTDIASFPMIWVIPLALYLLTFVIAFAKRPIVRHRLVVRIVPAVLFPLIVMFLMGRGSHFTSFGLLLNLSAFFFVALLCHGELNRIRPSTKYLTAYYLVMSLGGVLGGLFNSFLAPTLFGLPLEYPIAIGLGCLTLRNESSKKLEKDLWSYVLDIAIPLLIAIAAFSTFFATTATGWSLGAVLFAIVLPIIAFLNLGRSTRFALSVMSLLTFFFAIPLFSSDLRHVERNFFGVIRVCEEENSDKGHVTTLIHGTTTHGWQKWEDGKPTLKATSYYHKSGPLGLVFDQYQGTPNRKIGVVGLGCGTLMSYHEPTWHFTFYEIDPAIAKVAEDPRFFTFLSSKGKDNYSIVIGDGRQTVQKAADGSYDLLNIDAFSSDMIPTHLLTREAFAIYLKKLKPDGVIAIHISNRYVDLRPVIRDLGAEHGLTAITCLDPAFDSITPVSNSQTSTTENEEALVNDPDHIISKYVFVTRNEQIRQKLLQDNRCRELPSVSNGNVWTDDYVNMLEALWRGPIRD